MITHLGRVSWIRAELPQASWRLYSSYTQLCPSPLSVLRIQPAYSALPINEFINSSASADWLIKNGIDPDTASTAVSTIRLTFDMLTGGQPLWLISHRISNQVNVQKAELETLDGRGLKIGLTLRQQPSLPAQQAG